MERKAPEREQQELAFGARTRRSLRGSVRGAGAATAGAGRGLGRALRAVLAWAPVWVPAGLCLQFAARGLRPAWQEDRRLEEREHEMDTRIDGLLCDRALLEREGVMLEDPIWRERVRRSQREGGASTLVLADAARAAGGAAARSAAPRDGR